MTTRIPLSRRRFVALAAVALAAPAWARDAFGRVRTARLTVGMLPGAGPAAASTGHGATMGAEEAARAATLLGGAVTFRWTGVPAADGVRELVAAGATVILGTDGGDAGRTAARAAAESGALYLDLSPAAAGAACVAGTLRILPSAEMRVDAAADWLASARPGAAAAVVNGGPRMAHDAALVARALRRLEMRGMRVADGDEVARSGGALLSLAPTASAGETGADVLVVHALAPPPESGTERVVTAWHPSLERYGAGQVNDRFRARVRAAMDEGAWAGWIAVKAAWEAAARAGTADGAALRARLLAEETRFDGHKGRPLSFRPWDGQLRQPLYVVGGGEGAVAELPAGAGEEDGRDDAEVLDTLGTTAEEARCG